MKADERKKAILDCAKKLFSKQGYYQTHISHIVQEANIARGTVYQYFDNKDDIFITLLEDYFTKWRNIVSFEQANIDLNDISAKRYFQHRIRQTLLFLAEDSYLCNIALRIGLGLPEKVSMLADRFDKKIVDMIAGDLKTGQQYKTVRDSLNAESTAAILTGALFRTAYYYFVKKRKTSGYSEKEIDKITDEFIDLFLPGIFTPRDKSKKKLPE
ncbi:MAG: TetR/AcrR family transcriptional regulator [Desulfobacteraceae bacterium]|jgi:AcrR family transcriptional regulator